MAKALRALIVGLMLVTALAACGNTTGGSSATSAPAAAPQAAETSVPATAAAAMTEAPAAMAAETATAGATAGGAAMPTNMSGKLTLAGSSALLPVIKAAAEAFQAKNPNAQITVTAGGSGAGRTQVCEGKIDIGNSDVPLKDEEKQKLNCADAVQTPVAIQAFAPVANKQGPGSVKNLTKDQLVNIFNGTTKNWKEVGGDDQEIVLVNRAKGSGTRANMAAFLFGGDDTKFATGASEEDNSETVRQTVAQAPGAISYLGFAYLNNPDLVAFQVDGVSATKADIQNGKWKIGGPGYMITKGQGSELARAFIQFVISPEFQNGDTFGKLGFVPVAK